MKSLMQLLRYVLADATTWCHASTHRDLETITERVKHEGLSFLAISLPAFCTDFERSLDDGHVANNAFLGFKKRGSLPCLFRGLTSQVFDTGTGCLLEVPSHEAIFFIRQICLMWKKINLECSNSRISGAFDAYLQCESELRERAVDIPEDGLHRFRDISRLVWGSELQDLEHRAQNFEFTPRHGPGATAERISGNQKYNLMSWTTRLQVYFPMDLFAIPNWNDIESLERTEVSEPGMEIPVRVITVPKTLKTPRIIAIEPVCMQYTQQSIMSALVPLLEKSELLSGSLGFTDQFPNQELARVGSITQSLATLDLSEASDRVSNHLVELMLESVPTLSGAIQACRSLTADVPGRGVQHLTKFASMGSALCFPVEAMVFLTIILSGMQRRQGKQLTLRSVKRMLKDVRVYGDDIIVPIEYAEVVACELERFNLKVNTRKSFWTGKFRESCGRDWYDGTNVTVTYVRHLLPTSHRDASAVISTVSLQNQLYKAGLWNAAQYVRSRLEGVRIPLRIVDERSAALGLHSVWQQPESDRFCKNWHRPMVKAYVVSARPPVDPLDGYPALMKCFLHNGDEPMSLDHLERYGRPKRVDTKLRWVHSD